MKILLDKLLPVIFTAFLVSFVAVPFYGQYTVLSDARPDPKNKIDSAGYPLLSDSIMGAELIKADGTKLRLNDLKGKIVLLNLWATWSGPAREANPALMELQKKYGGDRLVVIGLNVGDGNGNPESPRDIEKFRNRFRPNYQLVRPANSVIIDSITKLTGLKGNPQSLLFGIDGSLRGIFSGGGAAIMNQLSDLTRNIVRESERQSVLTGTITDSFGSLVPHVKVTAKAKDGSKFECYANGDGKYSFAIPPGTYSISFSNSPFDPTELPKYQMSEHSIMTLDISLTCENCQVVN